MVIIFLIRYRISIKNNVRLLTDFKIMSSTSLLNTKVWPRVGLDHAPTKNNQLRSRRDYMSDLAQQFILYDRIVIPTNDFGIVPILIDWMGISTVFDALESDSLAFVRQHGCLGYAGNGNGISLFVVEEAPDSNKKLLWWQKAMFGDVKEALMLQLANGSPSISPHDRQRLCSLVLSKCNEFKLSNDCFIKDIVNESYEDVLRTPYLFEQFRQHYLDQLPVKLAWLPEVKKNEMRVSGIDVPNDPVDLLLHVAEINLELNISVQMDQSDIYTAEKTETLLLSKLQRAGLANAKLSGFSGILELSDIPDIRGAVAMQQLPFSEIWRARNTRNAHKFRSWLRNTTIADVRDLEKAYVASLETVPKVNSLPARVLRFVVTIAVSALEPISGLILSATDSFFVGRWLAGYTPKLFVDEIRKLDVPKENKHTAI
jgi:hypothetical protein